eukprot:790864-Pyramimonas_sp.AAC.1
MSSGDRDRRSTSVTGGAARGRPWRRKGGQRGPLAPTGSPSTVACTLGLSENFARPSSVL